MQSTSIIFKDEFMRTDRVCITTIKIYEELSNNTLVYNIDYHHLYKDPNGNSFECDDEKKIECPNPFYNSGKEEHFSGDIVVKNSLTTELVKYLMMENTDLEKLSGLSDPTYYKKMVLLSLSNFWD